MATTATGRVCVVCAGTGEKRSLRFDSDDPGCEPCPRCGATGREPIAGGEWRAIAEQLATAMRSTHFGSANPKGDGWDAALSAFDAMASR